MTSSRAHEWLRIEWSSLVLCASLSLSSAVARAQPSEEPAGYRTLIDDGIAEYDANHFTEARALFWQAHTLNPNARVLRCLGMAEFELRNYRDSATWLEQALASGVQALTPELRLQTEQLLKPRARLHRTASAHPHAGAHQRGDRRHTKRGR